MEYRDGKLFSQRTISQNSSGKAARRGLMLQKEWRVKTAFTELEIIWLGEKKTQKQTNRNREVKICTRTRTYTPSSLWPDNPRLRRLSQHL